MTLSTFYIIAKMVEPNFKIKQLFQNSTSVPIRDTFNHNRPALERE